MENDNLTWQEVLTAWIGWLTLAWVLYTVIILVSAVFIARKAGYSPWLGVIAVAVPVVGPLFILAFAMLKWPALKERDAARALLESKGIEAPKSARTEKLEQKKAMTGETPTP